MSVVARLVFAGAFFLSLFAMMVSWMNLLSISSSNIRKGFLLLREKFPGDLICRLRKFPASAASGLCFMASSLWSSCLLGSCLLTGLMPNVVCGCLESGCPSLLGDPV